jgi:MFS family permease
MMIGPLIGGWLITKFGWASGVQYALLICILLALLTFILQMYMMEEAKGTQAQNKKYRFMEVFRSFPIQLKELLLSDILIRFCERIPYAYIVLWVINKNGFTAQDFGFLVAIEMIMAMLCYIPVAHLADKHGQKPFILITFIFFTLFPISLMLSHNFITLAIAFAIRGLKEFGEPARKALIISYSPPELKSKTYGVYYFIRDCVVTLGSFLGAILWKISPNANFIGATIFGLLGLSWYYIFIMRKIEKNEGQL